jgi:hypothetical protein
MPRPNKGARLYKRKARYAGGKLVRQALWIIKDGDRNIATGCVAQPSETKPPKAAEQALSEYIARKYQPERNRRDIEEIDCADVLSIYLSDVGEPGDQFEIHARIGRLNEFWGGKTLSEVNATLAPATQNIAGTKAVRDETLKPFAPPSTTTLKKVFTAAWCGSRCRQRAKHVIAGSIVRRQRH